MPSVQVEPVIGPGLLADVDLRRQCAEILTGRLRRDSRSSKRPIETVTNPAAVARDENAFLMPNGARRKFQRAALIEDANRRVFRRVKCDG